MKIVKTNIIFEFPETIEHSYAKLLVDKNNVPTKEIKVTYNKETIPVYA